MSINIDEALNFEEFGIAFSDDNGVPLLYIAAGVGSPLGLDAPVPTLYVDETANIWRKFGLNNTDWAQANGAGGDSSIGGAGANLVFTPAECVGGEGA